MWFQEALLYFACWQGLNFACRFFISPLFATYGSLPESEQAYWNYSLVSSIHAVVISVMAFQALAETPALYSSSDLMLVTPQTTITFKVFWGYILQDTLGSIYYNSKWSGWQANLIHHLAAMLCWGQLLDGGFAHFMGLIGIISEITTPFVNLRWFLHKAGLKDTTLYLLNGLTMTLLWFIIRIGGFGMLGFRIAASWDAVMALRPDQQFTVVFSYVVGYSLQIFWFYKIVRGALKALDIGGGKKKA